MLSKTYTLPKEYAPDVSPMEHQLEAVSLGWVRDFFAYLLVMGLGKSRVAIDDFCLNYTLGHVDALLVVAPKSVTSNWLRDDPDAPGEIQKWLWKDVADSAVTYLYRAGKSVRDGPTRSAVLDAKAPGARILVVNVEAISATQDAVDLCERFLRSHRTMMVIDESTIIKDRGAKRTKRVTKMGKMAAKRRILTGSLITGSPCDAFGQFEFLEPGCLGHTTLRSFQSRYCILRPMRIGPREILKEVGTQNLEELRDSIAKHSIRKRKEECLDLPPKVYERVEVELTDEQRDAYKDMKRSAMLAIQDREVTTTIVMTQLMRLHQIAIGHVRADDGSVLRLRSRRPDALIEVIENSGDKKSIIWCNYREDADAVCAALTAKWGEGSWVRWTGAEGVEERERGEAAFQQDSEVRFMVATQSAGGRGRTWTAATLVVYYSNSYDLELREQSEDRAHRIGQTGTVTYVDLIAPGTVEEKIVKTLRSKRDVARAVQQDGVSSWI